MVYDAARGRTVLFGGLRFDPAGGTIWLQGTWEWDGADWTERVVAEAPYQRDDHVMAYDPVRERVVLFGGRFASVRLDDTWEWDGERWEQREPASSPPSDVHDTLAWDGRRETILFHGGRSAETWAWDGEDWTRLSPDRSPPSQEGPAAAWDSGRRLVVLSGPDRASSVWTWDGSSWSESSGWAEWPSGRHYPALAADTTRGRVVLFGGNASPAGSCGNPQGSLCSDTWTWDGLEWRREDPEHHPSARRQHGIAHHAGRGTTVLFGGCVPGDPGSDNCDGSALADTWEWDGEDWARRSPETSPPARYAHLMAWDAGRGEVVLHGGLAMDEGTCGVQDDRHCGDTWTWDGEDWSLRPAGESPPPRSLSALAYDPGSASLVLYGGGVSVRGSCGEPGQSVCGDTWTWDGDAWTSRHPAGRPVARYNHALELDLARGRIVLFAGEEANRQVLSDTWSWTGEDWRELAPLASGPARVRHGLVHDPTSGGVVVFGGFCHQASDCRQTWLYAPARWRPHLVAAFDLRSAATVEPTGADPSTRVLDRVTVAARAGGLGHTWGSGVADGERVPGYRVAVSAFGRGGWVELFRDPAGTPAGLGERQEESFGAGWTCGEPWCDDATIDRWTADDGKLYLDFSPLEAAGASPEGGELALDYVELRVRYWRTGCLEPSLLDPSGTPDGTPCLDGDAGTEGETCRGQECRAP